MTRGRLSFLLVVWAILAAGRCFVAFDHLPAADAGAQPRSFDARTSRSASRGAADAPAAFLQVGLLQIARAGLDEALLGACEVPLRRGVQQRVELQFGDPVGYAANGLVLERGRSQLGAERRSGLPESFGEVSRRHAIDFVWQGESSTGHLLQVLDDRTEHSDRLGGSAGSGSGGLCMPSVVLAVDQPWLFPLLHRGNVLILRIVDQSASAGDVGSVGFWRQACAGLAEASPRHEAPVPELGALAAVRVAHPFVVADPFESACLASIVFRDRVLAAAVLAKRGDYVAQPIRVWPEDHRAFYVQAWDSAQMAAVPTLLGDGSVMPWSVGEFAYQHAIAWRCLLLQEDPAIASAMVDALVPRLRTNNLWVMLLKHSELTAAPPVAAAWGRLRSAAIGEIGVPWSVALRVPGGLLLYLLLPFAVGTLVALGRARARPRAPLGRVLLVLLFAGGMVTSGEGVLRPLFGLCVVVAATADVRSSPRRSPWSRALILIAVAAAMFAAQRGTRFEVQLSPLGAFAEAGAMLVWILIGWRVLEDGRWRSPGCYFVFLLGLMLLWSVAPIDPAVAARAGLEWLVWAILAAFVLFLLGGRHGVEPAGSVAFAEA
ncbi:MAG: hypothetical protein H6838_05365 [Planctomycetes bacterium]|nr:hypothetical protein [Planctomycetota bacterium]